MYFACVLLLLNCTKNVETASGVSVTTNGFAMYSDSTIVTNAVVRLRSESYLVSSLNLGDKKISLDTMTNDSGFFSFNKIGLGRFIVEVSDDNGYAGALVFNRQDSTEDKVLPKITLKKVSTLNGKIDLTNLKGKTLSIQINGLERKVDVDSKTGQFSLVLPEGEFTLSLVENKSREVVKKIFIQDVVSADTVELPKVNLGNNQNEWSYFQKIYLNTSSTGANIDITMTDFPVMIRLDSTNFDFSFSKGTDLKFTRKREVLPHQVEVWDRKQKKAVIWVKIDSLFGNTSSQFIEMFWGRDSVVDPSSGMLVFDGSNSYGGVYHLSEDYSQSVEYLDATGNPANGKGVAFTKDSRVLGVLGYAQDFESMQSQYIIVDASKEKKTDYKKNITVSAWIKVESFDGEYASIVGKGEKSWRFQQAAKTNFIELAFSGIPGPYFYLRGTISVNDSTWHYVAGTYDGNTISLYVDGQLDTSAVTVEEIATDNLIGVYVGANASVADRVFDGMIDEVQIMGETKPAVWFQLSYENQKANQTLVEFRE